MEAEEEVGEEREASNTCSCVWLTLEWASPAIAATVRVDPLSVLACEGTEAAAGCTRGGVEWMEAGAVLGPASI